MPIIIVARKIDHTLPEFLMEKAEELKDKNQGGVPGFMMASLKLVLFFAAALLAGLQLLFGLSVNLP